MTIGLAIAIVCVTGLLGAGVLVLAAKFMAVEENPQIGEVLGCLPGANCGACGYAGCADYARAVAEEGAAVNKCIPGGAACADAVAAVMGTEAGSVAVINASVNCQGREGVCVQKFDYTGVESCAAAAALYGGPKACQFACLGLGDCVKACPFDCITVRHGLAVVNQNKCIGCGQCVDTCPHSVISLVHNHIEKPIVMCNNTEKGALTNKECKTGCIGCMKCEKTCPHGAIKVENFLARIDYDKCTGCGECVTVCPKKTIVNGKVEQPKAD